jgi:hypothetical protein
MPNQIQAGTMMVHQSAILQSLKIENEPYFQNWRSLGVSRAQVSIEKFALLDGVCFLWLVS